MTQGKAAQRPRSEAQPSEGGPPQGKAAQRPRSRQAQRAASRRRAESPRRQPSEGRPPQGLKPEMVRAFFAVELGEAARRAAESLMQRLAAMPGGDAVRWVAPESYHVTLRFLGSIPVERVALVTECVHAETGALTPFELRLGKLHAFPSSRRPRVVVLDVEPLEPISQLAIAVERGTVAAGFAPEARPFHAHVTLGRVRGPGSPPLTDTSAPAPFPVRTLVLFRSVLARSGATYTPLERIALGGAHSP